MKCFIIAEAGVNHNGDVKLAKSLIEAAKEVGADAVKFQTFKADALVNKTAQKAEYQKQNANKSQKTQYEMLKALELSYEAHHTLIHLAHDLDIEFMSTGFDEASVDFLVSLGVKRLKVPSGEITNQLLLEHMAKTKLPLIVSTGMCYLEEVKKAIDCIKPYYVEDLQEKITLLHCTSNYPAQLSDVNLKAMQTLAQVFNLPVGYSDHTLGALVPVLATGLGACVIEKHFTLDNALPGPDHKASMNPEAFKNMVCQIRDVEICMGSGEKAPMPNELPIRNLVRRSVTLKHHKAKGSVLNLEDLMLLRPGDGIQPHEMMQIIGKTVSADLQAGDTLHWSHPSS